MPETAVAKLRRVQQRLLKAYGPAPRVERRPILESLILAILAEGPTYRKASAVWRALQDAYADLNELRVATPRAIARICAPLDGGTRKAVLIRRILQVVIDETEEVSLEPWAHVGPADLKRRLLLLPGTNAFHAAYVVQAAKGLPIVYLTDDQMRLLKRLRLFPKDTAPTRIQDAIAKAFSPKGRLPFQQMLQAHALSVCAPEPRCAICVLADRCPSRRAPSPPAPAVPAKPAAPAQKAAPAAKPPPSLRPAPGPEGTRGGPAKPAANAPKGA